MATNPRADEVNAITSEELREKIKSYCSRITYLNDCFKLHKLMINSQKEYLAEINEFPAFYKISKKSFIYVCIIELAKLYERGNKNTSGIEKLINICDANQNLFLKKIHNEITDCDTDKIVESYDTKIDIQKDIQNAKDKLKSLETVIENLKGQRNKFYAHLDKDYQKNPSALAKDFPLNYGEIEKLIYTAVSICNMFYKDLCNTEYVCHTANWNDIKNVFGIVKEYKKIRDKEFKAQLEEMRNRKIQIE